MATRIPRTLLAATTPVLLLLLIVAGMRLLPKAEAGPPPVPLTRYQLVRPASLFTSWVRIPSPSSQRFSRGLAHLGNKDYADAARDLKLLVKESSGERGIRGSYALALQKTGDRKGYLQERHILVTHGLRETATDTERAYVVRLLAADALSDPTSVPLLRKMIEPLTKAARERPRSANNISNPGTLGLALCGAGQYQQAIAELAAVDKGPREEFQWVALALAYARTGDRAQARRARLRIGNAPEPEGEISIYGHWYNGMLLSRLTRAVDKALEPPATDR